MVLRSLIFCILLLTLQVLSVSNETDNRRPVWNIAHMVNALYQIDDFLDKGANAVEFDISFSPEGTAIYTFHGFPCDCFRSCTKYEDFIEFIQYLRLLTTPGERAYRKELVLLFMDFKVSGLSAEMLHKSGEDVALKLLDHYWIRGKSKSEAYIMVSLPSIKHVGVMESFLRTLRAENASKYIPRIGLDFSGNEDINEIKNILEAREFRESYWLGDGITNCLGRGTGRLRKALSERDDEDEDVSKVYWWTVDRKSTMRTVMRMGVDALITNYPHNLVRILQEDGFKQHVRLATIEDNPWQKHALPIKMYDGSMTDGNSTFYARLEEDEILYNSEK